MSMPECAFQIHRVPSLHPDATYWLFGETATAQTSSLCCIDLRKSGQCDIGLQTCNVFGNWEIKCLETRESGGANDRADK